MAKKAPTTAPTKKTPAAQDAQKLARVKKAKTAFKKADTAYDKAQAVYNKAKEELDAAVAAL